MSNQNSACSCKTYSEPTPAEVRLELHAILGQLHGLIHKATEHPALWCPPHLIEDIKSDYSRVGQTFGTVQSKINTDANDDQIKAVFLTGDPPGSILGGFGRRRFEETLKQFFVLTKEGKPSSPETLGSAVDYGSTVLRSLSLLILEASPIAALTENIKQAVEDKFKKGDQSVIGNRDDSSGEEQKEGADSVHQPIPKDIRPDQKDRITEIIIQQGSPSLTNPDSKVFFDSLISSAHLNYIEPVWRTSINDNAKRLVDWVSERKEFPHRHECGSDTPLGWLLMALLERQLQRSESDYLVKLIFDNNLILNPEILKELQKKYRD